MAEAAGNPVRKFHVYSSNGYEVLRAMLCSNLEMERRRLTKEEGGTARGFFQPIDVIVPSRAVETDLTRWIAATSDCRASSGVRFQLPGAWLQPYLGAPVGRSAEGQELEWLIWAKLLDRGFLTGNPRAKPLLSYLTRGGSLRRDDLKDPSDPGRLELAMRIAADFTKYSSYRFDWVQGWLDGDPPVDPKGTTARQLRERKAFLTEDVRANAGWEADLWKWLGEPADDSGTPRFSGARALRRVKERLAAGVSRTGNVPLHVFLPISLPPLMLPILWQKSAFTDVSLYLMNPSTNFWFDGTDRAAREGCGWLARNAEQVRAVYGRVWNFVNTAEFGEAEDDSDEAKPPHALVKSVRGSDIRSVFDPKFPLQDAARPGADEAPYIGANLHEFSGRRGKEERTLLDRVHEAVYRNKTDFLAEMDRDEAEPWLGSEPGLPSVRVARAPGLAREAEAVVDWIYALKQKYPDLRAGDILVAAPDMRRATPVFDSVLSALDRDERIEYETSGRSLEETSGAAKAFTSLVSFLFGRAEPDAFLDLIASPSIAKTWGFGVEDLGLIRKWLFRAGYRLGISEEHLEEVARSTGDPLILDGANEGTLVRALERLELGAAASDDTALSRAFLDTRPKTGGEGSESVAENRELFCSLVLFAESLEWAAKRIFESDGRTLDWRPVLLEITDRFFPREKTWWSAPDAEDLRKLLALEARTAMQASNSSGVPEAKTIPFAVLWSAFRKRIREPSVAARANGRMVLSSITAMRGIPFRAIAVVGLDSASGFPGSLQLDEFDLMGVKDLKRRGDRDSRSDNRNAFFDLVMAARDAFAVFYSEGPNRERPLEPSEVVTDFTDFLRELENSADSKRAALGLEPVKGAAWDVRLPLASYSRSNFTAKAREEALLGSDKEAFEALGKEEKPAEPFAPRGTPLLRGSDESPRRLEARELSRYLASPETTAMREAKIFPERIEERSGQPLDFPSGGLDGWAFRSEALRAYEAGIPREDFVRLRCLDPAYGAGAVRRSAIESESVSLWDALGCTLTGEPAGDTGPLELQEGDWIVSHPGAGLRKEPQKEGDRLFVAVAAASSREAWDAAVLALLLAPKGIPVQAGVLASLVKQLKDKAGKPDKDGKGDGKKIVPVILGPAKETAGRVLQALLRLYEAFADRSEVLPGEHADTPFYRTEEELKRKDLLISEFKDFVGGTLYPALEQGAREPELVKLESKVDRILAILGEE